MNYKLNFQALYRELSDIKYMGSFNYSFDRKINLHVHHITSELSRFKNVLKIKLSDNMTFYAID